MSLLVKNLHISIAGKEVLKSVDLEIKPGEVVALMGPNGSGKSTLAYALAGHPNYEVIKKNSKNQKLKAEISLNGEDLLEKTPDERARLGLFLAMQYPIAIPGVTVREALLAALRSRTREKSVSALELKKKVEGVAAEFGMNVDLLKRGLNEGFSGGEKKKMEILQMKILGPKYAVLDETDSGLDIDALKIVARGASLMAKKNKVGVLVITHYQRLLKYLRPDRVLVMKAGKIVREGGKSLVAELEKKGYGKIRED